MTQIKLVGVNRGDYEWIYVENKHYESNHRIEADVYLAIINEYGTKLDGTYAIYGVSDDYVDENGDLPQNFGDIPMSELEVIKEVAE